MVTHKNQPERHPRRRGRSAICVSWITSRQPRDKDTGQENIRLRGSITRARCQDSYSFPGGVLRRLFPLCVLFLLRLAIVILSSGRDASLHLPRRHTAIEEQMPVDPRLEENKVQCDDKGVMLDIRICGCAARRL